MEWYTLSLRNVKVLDLNGLVIHLKLLHCLKQSTNI